jgi:heavy metal sensor kinase
MGSLLDDHMLLVFFLYGLAFFLLGTAILMQPMWGSAFNIGNTLWLLGCFGLLHGLGEWMDMFLALGQKYWTPFDTAVLRIASFYFGAASFVCLLLFSLRLVLLNRFKRQFLERAALMGSLLFFVAVTSYGVVTGFSSQWVILSQVLMRYLLGFPGAILAAVGFWKQRKLSDIKSLNSYHVDRSLTAMAVIFAFYALFAGLVVPGTSFFPASLLNYETFRGGLGIPVQLFRMGCALLAAYFIADMLNRTIRSRVALWTALFLTIELIIFGIASGSLIYNDQLEAFGAIRNQPTSPIVIRKESNELIFDLTSAYAAALAVTVLVGALGVWWITRTALQPLQEAASAAEQIDAKALSRRLPEPRAQDEVGRLVRVLNHSFDRLERRFEQATRFSSDASHELKTPLTIMRGEIEAVLKEEVDNPRIQRLLDSLLAETQSVCDIVDKLLLLSRADEGALTLTKEILDFSAICHELAEDAEILARPKRITTEFEISPDVEVLADESYLRRVLLNLLDNAIKYNIEGGSLSISLIKSHALAVFRIANIGLGISKEHETRVFERFYRADPSRSSDTSGSGLGLSICREIVAAHGGQMWLDQPGSGWTAFIVTLSGPKSESHAGKNGDQKAPFLSRL